MHHRAILIKMKGEGKRKDNIIGEYQRREADKMMRMMNEYDEEYEEKRRTED